MSAIGSLLRFAFGLLELEWRQRRKRSQKLKLRVVEGGWPKLRVVQGGRR